MGMCRSKWKQLSGITRNVTQKGPESSTWKCGSRCFEKMELGSCFGSVTGTRTKQLAEKNMIFKTSQDRRSSFRHGPANGIHQIISVDLAIVCRHKLRNINVGYKDNGRTHLSYNQEMFYKCPLSQDYFALQSQMSVHNEDYSRNETCALYWIHTLLSISGEIPNDD